MRGRGAVGGVLVVLGLLVAGAAPVLAVDYPGAAWYPANTANYTSSSREGTYDITYIVVHVAEGSYSGTINWFQNSAAQASAHYVIAQDGRIAQMVLDKDIAWHAGNWEYNKHSIGIEHEGFTDQASTWTEAMYVASAKVTRWLADQHGIALTHPTGVMPASATTQTGIIGHNQVPDPNDPSKGGGANHHSDPGQYFDWAHYMDLVRGTGAFRVGITAPASNAWTRGTVHALGTTTADANLAWARWWMDGTVAKWATASPHAWDYDTRAYADGSHTLTFEAKDNAGTVASASITTRIDNTPPDVQLTHPMRGGVNAHGLEVRDLVGLTIAAGDVPVEAAASDAASGVARVEFRVDGQLRATVTSAPYQWVWWTGDDSLGRHTLAATAFDVAGNSRATTLDVDLAVPAP